MKRSTNKLSLNKMTISNLDMTSMSQMVGGVKQSKLPGLCITKLCPTRTPDCTIVKQ